MATAKLIQEFSYPVKVSYLLRLQLRRDGFRRRRLATMSSTSSASVLMAAHPNRSPSPLSHRPKIFPENNSARKSFNNGVKPSPLTSSRRFDPSVLEKKQTAPSKPPLKFLNVSCPQQTPANSPSVFLDPKENCVKATRSGKLHSGSRRFMAPTISAAAKFRPSPKKKQTVVEGSTSTAPSKPPLKFLNVSCPQQTTELVETKKVESRDKPSCSLNSISIAPLDADRPYDPKTNILGPRPQFLYYKPNPRIGLLLNKEKAKGDQDEIVTAPVRRSSRIRNNSQQ